MCIHDKILTHCGSDFVCACVYIMLLTIIIILMLQTYIVWTFHLLIHSKNIYMMIIMMSIIIIIIIIMTRNWITVNAKTAQHLFGKGSQYLWIVGALGSWSSLPGVVIVLSTYRIFINVGAGIQFILY